MPAGAGANVRVQPVSRSSHRPGPALSHGDALPGTVSQVPRATLSHCALKRVNIGRPSTSPRMLALTPNECEVESHAFTAAHSWPPPSAHEGGPAAWAEPASVANATRLATMVRRRMDLSSQKRLPRINVAPP